ncbi:hypothetical protein LMG26689_05440 [Achromobacter animicus]|uniref:Uncharacterized protein n=1 Tax=Achromobacter animicus TaxID=1389935 RepID=A0A6S7ANE2_9BURK|nr:hypothetical protein LMG26690_05521 [Achromobacter animicus]CAB3918623.1 hypothetical protein LMG26691_05419 [Achromobacter animicus]CAB3918986.1 hypothetical protein LMG26689_05440 [Achromobacter animicus]CAB3922996.1 hypothetical protein LMG26684_05854 [Achromobacter mucicolens]
MQSQPVPIFISNADYLMNTFSLCFFQIVKEQI